jgi:hypothetical protein
MALFGPMVGGYAGGVEGTAVVSVASHLQGLMVNQGHLDVFFPFHIVQFCNTTRELLWMTSLVYQALARNSPFLSLSNGIGAAGPCTRMALLEAAAHGLTSTVSGAHLWEFFSARNRNKDRTTPWRRGSPARSATAQRRREQLARTRTRSSKDCSSCMRTTSRTPRSARRSKSATTPRR